MPGWSASRQRESEQQSNPLEPHPEDTVMLNDAVPEEEHEQGAGQEEDDT